MPSDNSVKRLGDFVFNQRCFEGKDEIFRYFDSQEFQSENSQKQKRIVNEKLFQAISSSKDKQFLLFEVVDFISKIRNYASFERYNLVDFELWLNQFSGLSEQENYMIRALIAGKLIPRDEYQVVFPVGMNKVYEGSHVVTAHSSPDLDTIVASFWGWMDAFSARVSKGLHVWNVPGGPPKSHVEVGLLFKNIFGEKVFEQFSKARSQLSLTSFDLMTQEGFIQKKPYELSLSPGVERSQAGVVIVDEDGFYKGDWRALDVESVRQVIMSLNACLRWFESDLRVKLISLFSKETVNKQDIIAFNESCYRITIKQCEPTKEYTKKQLELLDKYLKIVLKVEKGVEGSLEEFSTALQNLKIADFNLFRKSIGALANSELFDASGKLIEDRPKLFFLLEKIIKELNEIFKAFRLYVDTLDVGFKVKTEVFGLNPQYISQRTEVEEIQSKITAYPYLTVNVPGPDEKQIPVGLVRAADLKKKTLGTVTLRDFCNRDETRVPSYFEVISVIDHHKSVISTTTAPTASVCDAQSANAIVASLAFQMHDNYCIAGMDEESVDKQIKQLQEKATTRSDFRVLQRLFKKKERLHSQDEFFVSPDRIQLEYIQYIFAILDDTDLLTKVSYKDVVVMKDLLNRLKTLQGQKEVEIIDFDDLVKNEHFVQKAADKLLQNEDLYSLYSKVYEKKEQAIEENLNLCSSGQPSNLFVDTKFQNGCARVGQTKLFAKNIELFDQKKDAIRKVWLEESLEVYKDHENVDVHIQMLSTIASSEELFRGEKADYKHKDQMWVWIPEEDIAKEHLQFFLSAFKKSPKMQNNEVSVEVFGNSAKELSSIFKESFLTCKVTRSKEKVDHSFAVIYYLAGSINSRKAAVSPYLPKVED